jgi:hypothetical protein
MVKVSTGPEHETEPLVNVGVTVIVAKIGSLVLFVAVKLGIPVELPTLVAANPIEGLSFVQVYVVVVPPVLTVANVIAVVGEPAQIS